MSEDRTLAQLEDVCKCGIYLMINQHRDYYQTVEQYLKDVKERQTEPHELASENVVRGMIETNTIVHLQFYPMTPIGFYEVYGYVLPDVINEAFEILEKL